MTECQQDFIPLNLDVVYKKSYARHFKNGQLKRINNSEAYLFIEKDKFVFNHRKYSDDKKSLNLKDKISIVLKLGERKRTLQASVISTDSYGAKVKFHFYNNRDYQIVDDLIYFIEKSKEKRRQRLDFIFDQTF